MSGQNSEMVSYANLIVANVGGLWPPGHGDRWDNIKEHPE